MKRIRQLLFSIIGVVFFTLPLIGLGAEVTISPVHVHFVPGDTIQSLQIYNQTDAATTFQADMVTWSQAKGKDSYGPTQDFIISPPIFTIAPHDTQIIRIGMSTPPAAAPVIQKTYRIVLTEIIPYTKVKTQKVRLRVSLPLFVDAMNPKKEVRVENHHGKIAVVNTGNMTVTIGQISTNGQKQTVFLQIIPGAFKVSSIPFKTNEKIEVYDRNIPLTGSANSH